eukprot:XP_014778411.1 PREDICTED: nicolin-1-like isoform X3 [Octopus bimaculoides]
MGVRWDNVAVYTVSDWTKLAITNSRLMKSTFKTITQLYLQSKPSSNLLIKLICELTNVVELKLILLQPSPVWIDFSLEDIKLFRGSQKPVDKEIKDDEEEHEVENDDGDECMKYNPFGMDLSAISKTMQKWSLVNQPLNSRSKVKQIKYEINGSYDIKLLSYS